MHIRQVNDGWMVSFRVKGYPRFLARAPKIALDTEEGGGGVTGNNGEHPPECLQHQKTNRRVHFIGIEYPVYRIF